MSVITIARQRGAGGGEVATRVADRLGYRLLERALVERIAAELHVAPEEVEACDERVESFVERLGLYLSEVYPEVAPLPPSAPVSPDLTARMAQQIVSRVVDEGAAVIVGHGAQCVLQKDPRAFHVLIHASHDFRVERIRRRFELDAGEATERVREADVNQRDYIREHFDRNWLDPALYHLCVDSSRVGIDLAVELIHQAVTRFEGIEPG